MSVGETAHGSTRGHHMERRRLTAAATVTESVSQRFCAHCGAWVDVRGVTGALAFMSHHDSGDCKEPSWRRSKTRRRHHDE